MQLVASHLLETGTFSTRGARAQPNTVRDAVKGPALHTPTIVSRQQRLENS